jgi:LPS O-antigen subunit length determinant protein (WzzB/FepE family)
MEREALQAQLEKEAHELEAFINQVNQEITRRQARLQLLRELLSEKEGEPS